MSVRIRQPHEKQLYIAGNGKGHLGRPCSTRDLALDHYWKMFPADEKCKVWPVVEDPTMEDYGVHIVEGEVTNHTIPPATP